MALPKAPKLLRCKETLRMAPPKAPKFAALRNYSTNGSGEGVQGAALPKYRPHGAGEVVKVKPAAKEARTRRNARARAHSAAAEGAMVVVDTPSSCEASPEPTKQRGKRGGRQVHK